MNATRSPKLRSLGIAKLLKGLIRGLICLNLIQLIVSFIKWNSPAGESVVALVVILLLLFVLSIYISRAIWLFKLHQDLKECYPDYPISPWRATLTCSIPVVSIWGIWNVATGLANRLKQSPDLKHYGEEIANSVHIAYFISFTPGLWIRSELRRIEDEPAFEHIFIYLASTVIEIIIMCAVLSVLKNTTEAIKELARGEGASETKIKIKRLV